LLVLQLESAKRLALEQRLHSQLLLQSETMVAMELKLLRLEAKVERSEAAKRQRQHVPTTTRGDVGAVQLSQREPTATPTCGMEQTKIAAIASDPSLESDIMVGSSVGDGNDSERTGRIISHYEVESQQSSE
jgi:hypothetical protein